MKAKPKPKVRRKVRGKDIVLSRRATEAYRRAGMSPRRIAAVIADAEATKLRVEALSLPRPPRVTLPGEPKVRGLTSEVAGQLCECLMLGSDLALAANMIGLDPGTLARWLRETGEPYATFQDAVRRALAYGELNSINAVKLGKFFDPGAAVRWLEMKYPKKYRPLPPANVTLDFGSLLQEAWERRGLRTGRKPAQVDRAVEFAADERRELGIDR